MSNDSENWGFSKSHTHKDIIRVAVAVTAIGQALSQNDPTFKQKVDSILNKMREKADDPDVIGEIDIAIKNSNGW